MLDSIERTTGFEHTQPNLEGFDLYEDSLELLSTEAKQMEQQVTELKDTAIEYVGSDAFLDRNFHPPETNPGVIEHPASVRLITDEKFPIIERTVYLPASGGQRIMATVTTVHDNEERAHLETLQRIGNSFGYLNEKNSGVDNHQWRARQELVQSGLQNKEDKKAANVTLKWAKADEGYEVNGKVERWDDSSRKKLDGHDFDPKNGLIDKNLFADAERALKRAQVKKPSFL